MVCTAVDFLWHIINRQGGYMKWFGDVELIVVILIDNISDPHNVPFTGKNDVSLLIGRVNDIKHLLCLLSQYERIVVVSQHTEINGDKSILIPLDSASVVDPLTVKHGNLKFNVI